MELPVFDQVVVKLCISTRGGETMSGVVGLVNVALLRIWSKMKREHIVNEDKEAREW